MNQKAVSEKKEEKSAISPRRDENYPEWYQQVVKAADLAENSPVRGCMVIKPWGYAIWENIQQILDGKFKETGVKNAYFPLFIPKRFLEKEAQHVEGFAKECAVVTHHRLQAAEGGGLVPAGELDEPLVVRPTSETIIGESFSRWVASYRDLPLLINQWCNVVRWEMRTRIFLRTSEFLWQEGHTAHADPKEAMDRTRMMLDIYQRMVEDCLAVPVIKGEKTEAERFPGAANTFSLEAMMQDRKALQAGTSHFLGQNFAKASNIKFQSAKEQEEFAWTTSWGVSTRLIGALIMTHSDDDGLVLPPRIAPAHVVLLPIIKKPDQQEAVMKYTEVLAESLRQQTYYGRKVAVEIDGRQIGGRTWDWIKKGIPVRVEIGPRDMAEDSVFVGRRDQSSRNKTSVKREDFVASIFSLLDEIQKNIFDRALAFQKTHTVRLDSAADFYAFFTPKDAAAPEIHGGFALSHWCGDKKCEQKINDDLSVTIRCVPLDCQIDCQSDSQSDSQADTGTCVVCGGKSVRRVVFAKSY